MVGKFMNNLLFGEEKYRYLVEFVVFSFFFTLAVTFIIEIWNSLKGDRYLHEHHYEHWKLTKGTIAQRKEALKNPVDDPVYVRILNRTSKLWNILLGFWLLISLIITVFVVVIDKLR